ncbi:MAG TPA: prolyl oligopeptidase family serine peptidase [Vicinamibacterales bacterium]|nr:prolyl oligopeptidase family serine peptidase [Vicinamibacterales bacterium]
MKTRFVVWTGLVLVVALQFIVRPVAQDAGVRALYDRAESLNRRTQNLIYNVAETPQWVQGAPNLFTYRKSVKGGNEFVLVDAAAKTKAPAFDHAKLAASLSTAAAAKYTAITLPFNTFTFVDNRQAIEFAIGGGGRQGGGAAGGRQGGGGPAAPRWHCTLTDYTCTRAAASPAGQAGVGAGQGRGGGQGAGRGAGAGANATENVRASLDGKWEALIQNYNVFVRPAGDARNGFMLSTDGSEGNAYTFSSLRWSPDSTKLAIMRRRPGYERLVHYVESSPADQLQPKHSTNFYRKPGDVVDFDQPVVFDVATKKQMLGDMALFPNPYANNQLAWRSDSRAVTFEYNQRGHQLYRVVEIDANTGKTRTVIEEASKTFVEYSGKKYRNDVNDGKEIIWASERDGWNHLYLYDGVTGQVKNQITRGQWVVRGVDDVNPTTRQIVFRASGMDAGMDPYLIQYCRINFDGTGLTRLTTEDGNHAITWSPDKQFYFDTWSRVDAPPQSALKRASDQTIVMPLEKADITDLLATGWRAPEVFTSKARDGQTDIWGVIIRPTNFDPAKKYPVIENIYAGPQGSFAPKTFSTQAGMQALAEFGFIVVQVDGMGTSNRSKAFHDVAWQNLGDAGFPDRIIWHKAIAAKYPYYDITRVGIYGTSAGGQNATGGLLFHPEFYKVAVSNSGCHDNRMDKIWWNEQWMGWPIGPHYGASSNVDNAKNLKGRLQLVVPEMDTNVDPSSTMQVVNALVRASKDFELVVIPGASHGAGSPITARKRNDFFVKHLLGIDPPNWNAAEVNAAAGNGDDAFPEPDYFELERAPFFPDDVR